jgi:hypothetical protein
MKDFVSKLARIVAGLLAVAAILHGQPTAAGGSVLWYNGDYDGRDTQVNQTLPTDGRIYDEFIVPTGVTFTITSVFSNNFMFNPSAATTAAWEIRSGVSAGFGGTLLDSGDGTDALTATGRFIVVAPYGNINEYTNSVSVNVTLGAGTYWLSVAPDVGNQPLFGPDSFIGTTSGANAVGTPPGNDGNSFFSSTFFGQSFVPTTDPSIEGPGTWDYSMGVFGTAVPEPSSLVLGLVGLVSSAGCVWARRRTRS